MAAYIHPDIFDDGLDAGLKGIADATNVDLHINYTQQPTTYAEATSTYTCGDKQDITITGPSAGDASGRKVTISAITDGDVTASQTAGWFSLVDTNTSRLLVAQALSGTQAVTNGNVFTLTAFDVEIPDPA